MSKISKCKYIKKISNLYLLKPLLLFILQGAKNSEPIKKLDIQPKKHVKSKKNLFILNLVPVEFKVGTNVISIFNLVSRL